MLFVTSSQFLKLLIFANFLSPFEFGMFAIISVVIGFTQAFIDAGMSNAIIHHRKITALQLSSLYWLNILAGIVFFLILAIFAPHIANFYDEEELTTPLVILSSIFIFASFGNQYRTLLQKEMMFNLIAKIEIFSAIISLLVAFIFAFQGYGVYAIVLSSIAQVVVNSILFLIIGLKYFSPPLLTYQHSELKKFYSFGLYQIGEKSINYFSTNFDKLLIGKFLGIEAAGFYNMAWQIIIFPVSKINPIINRVVLPMYAEFQDNVKRLNLYYLQSIRYLSLVTIPILVYIGIYSEELVLLFLGGEWSITAKIIIILALVGIIRALGNPGGAILVALGFVRVTFWWNVFWSALVCISIYLSLIFYDDLLAVPLVLLFVQSSFGMLWHYLISHYAKINYKPVTVHFLKVFAVTMSIAMLSRMFNEILSLTNFVQEIIVSIISCIVMYLLYLVVFEKDIFKLVLEDKK